MLSKGITEEAIEKVAPLFSFSGTNHENLDALEKMLETSKEGLLGVQELRFIVDAITALKLQTVSLQLDVTLARGLNYYTGAIYEVSAPKSVKIGSIGGGGRYDDLTGVFGLKEVSGVGISFGLDRIYLVMDELNLFETVDLPKPKILFLNFKETESLEKMKAIQVLRKNNIKAEMYPDVATSNKQEKKQWKYATNRNIDMVVTDIEENKFIIKNRQNGEQLVLTIQEILDLLQ
jgi:histidyl-tRNA synthetase